MKNSTPFTSLSWKQGNILPHLSASASRWFYYKTVHWNFKYCGVQTENVSYWFTVIQSISNHVSWSHAFLIGFPVIISKLEIFNWISVKGLDTINRFCTLYFSLKRFTSPSTVTMLKSHKRNCQNSCGCLTTQYSIVTFRWNASF